MRVARGGGGWGAKGNVGSGLGQGIYFEPGWQE